jgi:hypothetical protein
VRDGNWARIQEMSRAVGAAASVVGMVIIHFYHADGTRRPTLTFRQEKRLGSGRRTVGVER